MVQNRSQSGFKARHHRGQAIFKAVLFVLLVSIISFATVKMLNTRENDNTDRKEFQRLWAEGAYDEVFRQSGEQLAQNPLDYFLLTIHGFSAYQLAIAQINNFDMLSYIDDCIWSLRKALLFTEGPRDGRLLYVLGKAYYYKGPGYSDLAIKYLTKTQEAGYTERDIPEYLGMAYISVNDYRNSVAAFSLALNPAGGAPSDTLLLAIAGAYIALGDDEAANAYLVQCLQTSRDSNIVSNARLFLGEILFRKGDSAGAEEQYQSIINENGGNAEAHFRLGELYSGRGETIRARAEWRKALQIDPTHSQTRNRLGV